MTKTALLLICLLCLSVAHKDKQGPKPNLGRGDQMKPIYQPFTDAPKPSHQISDNNNFQIDEKTHDHEDIPEERKEEYEQFNEMLSYGLIFGTLLLSCMLLKTCASRRKSIRKPVVQMVLANPQPMTREPMLNRAASLTEIKNKIQWHKNEIKRLELSGKQVEQMERKAAQQRRRQEQTLKAYYQQAEMQPTGPRVYYNNQNYACGPQYYQADNIPVGRPLPRDNDSSFASEYPVL